MKWIWLEDDERVMPEGYDIHCRTTQEAIQALSSQAIGGISIGNVGYNIINWMIESAHTKQLPKMVIRTHIRDDRSSMWVKIRAITKYWST